MRYLPEHQRAVRLSIVATPIGNLSDLSSRAIETLQNVDYILCEDTRRAQKLKAHFSLKPRLISFHEHNESSRLPKILDFMERGKSFALISDAGTPLLSDPGEKLVREMIQRNIPFTYIPGPSAAIAALVLSGMPVDRFCFLGFLPAASAERKKALTSLLPLSDCTIVLFESPQRIIGLLREIGEVLGDREVAVCREMTKLHEEVVRGKVSEVLSQLSSRRLMGEFTVVIGKGAAEPVEVSDDLIRNRFHQLQQEGLSKKDALKKLVKETGRSKNDLYDLLMKD